MWSLDISNLLPQIMRLKKKLESTLDLSPRVERKKKFHFVLLSDMVHQNVLGKGWVTGS